LLFTLVGPAGAGKSRLLKHVLANTDLRQLPTATTRGIRPGEQEGREHLYVSRERFHDMIDNDELLEYQVIHGNLYGMPRSSVEAALDSGQSIIADIEVLGAARAREIYPENVVSIFIQPPSIGSLIERMRERRESEAEIGKRLLRVPMELDYARTCHYLILNDKFDHAAELLYQIVASELRGESSTAEGDPLVDYQCTFEAQITPIFRDKALRPASSPYALAATFTGDEMPQQVALNCLHTELQIDVNEAALINADKLDGDYLPPITLKYARDPQRELISYLYLYCLTERITAPSSWSWSPVEALPETLRVAVPECAP
jgi:guanylate kinase